MYWRVRPWHERHVLMTQNPESDATSWISLRKRRICDPMEVHITERRNNKKQADRPRAVNTRTALTSQLESATGVAVADHATARQKGKAAAMNDDVKAVIDEIANSLQVINLLSTRLRQDLGESAQHAIDLEGATAGAVRAMKRLQPDGKKQALTI